MIGRRLLFIPPILLGGLVVYLMSGSGEVGEAPAPAPVAVRIDRVEPESFRAAATGYGRIQAELTWQAISQVQGRAIATAPDLAIGEIMRQGALLVEIDPRDYEIAQSKAEAAIASAGAELQEIAVQEENTASLLEIERRIEAVSQADYDRQQSLLGRGASSQAAADEAQRALLGQQKVVRDLENQLDLLPAQRLSLEATLMTRQVELEEAERNLANTKITAPFTGRVSEKSVTEGQYVRSGDALLSLESIATSEVVAEFQPAEIRSLILIHGEEAIGAVLAKRDPEETLNMFKQLGFEAIVRVGSADESFEWPAEIVRFNGEVDAATGAIGIVARITDPTRPDLATRRPPLPNGSFAELRLAAQPKELLLIPRSALRRDGLGAPYVYVMDSDSRLDRREVSLGPVFGEDVVLLGGLEPGARLVLSDPRPAILGMALVETSLKPGAAAPSPAGATDAGAETN